MDFVVVGLGLGAIGILLGLLLRDAPSWRAALAPGRDLAVDDPPPVADTFARGLGTFLLVGGAALTVLTFLGLGTGLSDERGTLLVAGTVTIALIGLVAWLVQQLRHRPRPRPAAPAAVRAPEAPPADAAPGTAAMLGAAAAAGAAEFLEASEAARDAEGFGLSVESTVVYQEASERGPEAPEADESPLDATGHLALAHAPAADPPAEQDAAEPTDGRGEG